VVVVEVVVPGGVFRVLFFIRKRINIAIAATTMMPMMM